MVQKCIRKILQPVVIWWIITDILKVNYIRGLLKEVYYLQYLIQIIEIFFMFVTEKCLETKI